MGAASGRRVLVIGATSSIAREMASLLAEGGHRLHLAGRDRDEVERVAGDLSLRYPGAAVGWSTVDLRDFRSHPGFVEKAVNALGGLDAVIVAAGELGEQAESERDFAPAQAILESNYVGVVSLLTPLANLLEEQGSGSLTVIGSVAGERGRASNYVYGSAKGGLAVYLQGLRARLFRAGVSVTTVQAGFVDTKMTFGRPGMFLVASPGAVAARALAGSQARRAVVYAPGFWRWVMLALRSVPEPVFKRLKL